MSGDIVAGSYGEGTAGGPREYAAFKIEQRGIDLIPDSERKMRPAGLFWLWAGAVFNVEFLFYGTLIMTFGLTVVQAIAAIGIGNLFYTLLGWASLQGPKTGTTAFMVSRAPFGAGPDPMPDSGYVLKESAGAEIVQAVTAVFNGDRYLSPRITGAIIDELLRDPAAASPIESLSPREREVLHLTVTGASSAEIGQRLSLSRKTVDTYRSRVMGKLGVPDLAGLIRFAVAHAMAPV